jgi:hypothetical protein
MVAGNSFLPTKPSIQPCRLAARQRRSWALSWRNSRTRARLSSARDQSAAWLYAKPHAPSGIAAPEFGLLNTRYCK